MSAFDYLCLTDDSSFLAFIASFDNVVHAILVAPSSLKPSK